jgi:hypothetical protein
MITKDKYFIGFLAGIIASVPMDVLDFLIYIIFKILGYQHIVYADYATATLLEGKVSFNMFELVAGQVFQIIHCGIVGSIYVVLLYVLKERSNLFKGWLIGIITWFIAYLTGVHDRIELFMMTEMYNVLANLLTSSVFGISMALVFQKLWRKFKPDENVYKI